MDDDQGRAEALGELLARLGIAPIAGHAPDDEVPAGNAGDVAGGGGSVDGEGGEGAEGTDAAEGVEGAAAEGAAEGAGDAAGAEGAEGEDADALPEGREFDPKGAAGGRAQERIFDLLDTVKALTRQNQLLQEGRGGEGNGAGKGYEMPAELAEVDKHLRPYMLHYFQPLVREFQAMKTQLEDVGGRAEFYADNPDFTPKQRGLIENAARALRERFGPVSREDVVHYLRGNPRYTKDFAVQEGARERLDRDTAAARRGAGNVAGRRPAAAGARGAERSVDLAGMSSAERIKHFETTLKDVAF